jgi:hypothetical protein
LREKAAEEEANFSDIERVNDSDGDLFSLNPDEIMRTLDDYEKEHREITSHVK